MDELGCVALLLLVLGGARLSAGHATLMCAHVGEGNGAQSITGQLWWHKRYGSFSIGAEKYDSKYGGWPRKHISQHPHYNPGPGGHHEKNPDGSYVMPFCPYKWRWQYALLMDFCDVNNQFDLKIYAVKQKGIDGVERELKGWLHIELKLTSPTDEFRAVYLQMRDEHFNAIGEFVMDPKEQCPSTDESQFVSPTNKQYLPCTATGLRETSNSQALFMVHPDIMVNDSAKDPAKGYVPAKGFEGKRGIHFTWRFGEYWCNRHFMIRPDFFILTKKNVDDWEEYMKKNPNVYAGTAQIDPTSYYPQKIRKIPNYWVRPGWLGAYDIKLPSRTLQCSEPIMDDSTGVPTGAAPWIIGSIRANLTNDYINPDYVYIVRPPGGQAYASYQSCQADTQGVRPQDAVAFQGRCSHLFKSFENGQFTRPSKGQFHTCNMNSNTPEFEGIDVNFTLYKNYTGQLQAGRNATCNIPCRPPLDTKDVEEIKTLNVSGTTGLFINSTLSNHSTRTTDSLAKFWRGRKFHGILCIICTMFLTPVSLFAARYYKETGMKHVFAGLQIWYWIHVANSLGLFAIYYSSQMAIRPSIASWGHNEDDFATAHYSLGWISHAIFTAMLVFGGIRGRAVPMRRILMTAHSVLGFAQYLINIGLVLISTWIPASPTADVCGDDGLPTGFSTVAILTLTWASLDILIHAVTMFFQMSVDTRVGFRRPWYCPIVPVVDSDSNRDMRGSFFRKFVFIVYVGISGGFMLATVLTVVLSEPLPDCSFGEMTCKSPLGCSAAALAMCKKLKYSNC